MIQNESENMNARLIPIPFMIMAAASALALPTITRQPADFSVSIGANVTNTVTASSDAPSLTYQWRINDLALDLETNRSLIFTNVQLPREGNYTVVVSDASGSVTSRVARLTVDPTFTKITTGSIVTDRSLGWSGAWGDYNHDGFIDLVVGTTGYALMYRNNGDGSFNKVTNTITTVQGEQLPIWSDYDNDGFLDLFIAQDPPGTPRTHQLYRNKGDGTFARITTGALVTDSQGAVAPAWSDYDNDGFLDVMLAKFTFPKSLYRNNGHGDFRRMTRAEIGDLAVDSANTLGVAAADYDDDGDADFVFTEFEPGQPNKFYRNNGNGTFTLENPATFAIGNKTTRSAGIAVEDFFNRGKLDVFIVNGEPWAREIDFYYGNNGDGSFTRLASNQVGSVVAEASTGAGCAAADYDNDGDLDLFVTNPGLGYPGPPETSALHQNNGDGTFKRIHLGSPTSDLANPTSCSWGDYDNDGFMDLFVANGGYGRYDTTGPKPQAAFLYRNNGNSNRWIKLKLVGAVSNRSAVGAKVRVKTTVAENTVWQMRHVNTGSFGAHNDMRPHFGLGNATVAETVRIEWPSGIVQELHNVPANQILTVTEPARLEPHVTQANGLVELRVKSWKGFAYDVETSNDLKSWTRLTTLTNETGTLSFADALALGQAQRFYRAVGK